MNTTADIQALPDKPSELIRLALADLQKIEQTPGYRVSMGNYHYPAEYADGCDDCYVCAAGAVMAVTLHKPRSEHARLEWYPEAVQVKLRAISGFALGNPEFSVAILGLPESVLDGMPEVPGYSNDYEGFYRGMFAVSDHLAQQGY